MKYVVKNCPILLPMTGLCDSENLNKPSTYCQDCTDCIIKQVINYCLEQNLKYDTTACDILQLFDTEGINK